MTIAIAAPIYFNLNDFDNMTCTHLVNDLPSDEIAARLEQLCARPLEFLSKITNAEIAKKSQTTTAFAPVDNNENAADSWQRLSQDPVLWLDRLAAIYRVLSPWQKQDAYLRIVNQQQTNGVSAQMPTAPWLELSSRVWKVVSVTLDQFQENQRIVEKCCRTVRFLVRSMGIQSIVFIEQLAHQMMEIYTKHPTPVSFT
uniref:Uncharacterized protein n=1 Tax=Ditylenchus dipsaci TaxID=166011 RepID=A0A915DPC3_9BILA